MNENIQPIPSVENNIEEEGISLSELFHIFRERFRWFLLVLILSMGAAVAYLYFVIPTYQATVSVLVDPVQKSSSLEDLMSSSLTGGSSTKIQTEVALLTSRKTLSSALATLDLSSYTNADGESYATFYKLPDDVSHIISVSNASDTNIVKISVTDENPQFARDFANAIAKSYDDLLTSIAKSSKTVQREFLEKQIPANEADLETASDKLAAYKESTGIDQLTQQAQTLVTQIAYFDLRKHPLEYQKTQAKDEIDKLVKAYSSKGVTADLLGNATTTQSFKALEENYRSADRELVMYEVLVSNQTTGTAETAAVSDVMTRSATLSAAVTQFYNSMLDDIRHFVDTKTTGVPEADLRNYVTAVVTYATCQIKLEVLDANGQQYKDNLDRLPAMERDLANLQRNVTVLQTVGVQLRQMLEEVKLTEAAVNGNVTIIDQAVLPEHPVSPNKLLVLAVAFLLGCALGLLLCLFIDHEDNTVKNVDQIKEIVGNEIPVLGWVPMLKTFLNEDSLDPKTGKPHKFPLLSVYNDPNSFESERYKTIVSNLLYGGHQQGNKTLAVTSCGMSEGKTTLMFNCALCLAQLGKKVLLIDGDLKAPKVENSFKLKRVKVGMVDCIMTGENLEYSIIRPLDDVPNMHILPPGRLPLVTTTVFSNSRFDSMIKALSSYYDYILIDAPPLINASELLLISNKVDSVMINVRAGISTKASLYDLIEALEGVSFKIRGVVLNACTPEAGHSSSRYSRSYGNRYGYGNYGYGKYGSKKYGYGGYGYGGKGGEQNNVITTKHYSRFYKIALKNRKARDAEHFSETGKAAFTLGNAPRFTQMIEVFETVKSEQVNQELAGKKKSFEALQKSVINGTGSKTSEGQDDSAMNSLLDSLANNQEAYGKN
ncbi:MAG: polysaccharide biosynthesis tyrosine autokinase [Spirochaetia bacterium]|jgi:capsular exopolysaccharide synthesis family protein|nr:polysaccharide biosynthesis tyrosine autokinase [Spirochaetia bacterium]